MSRPHLFIFILLAASLLCLLPWEAEAAPLHHSGFVKIGGKLCGTELIAAA